ncbi:hypothetical protein BDQ12DRAFT_738568 [Crucibulum laeve]|uniref:DUF6534 domain-containing protein n=1 Tax=Crucibulum laeve TaxID=68775 RepID=A0A5C3LMK4_9AGAR|nr:hypothetical protein BDQ12DRAFT_738568 [Crucibulum laeve]
MVAPTLDNTLGAGFLGTVAAATLFGITSLQVWMYFQNYPNDWRFQKFCVANLWILDAVHLAFIVHAVYHYIVTSFGSFAATQFVVWSFKLQIAINVAIVLMVQSLYGLRVWTLGRHFSRLLPSVVIVIIVVGYAIGIILVVKTYQISTFTALSNMSWIVYTSFAYSTGVDVVIATAVCLYLKGSRTTFASTNAKIIAIMKYVLISGFLTSACSLACLITYATMPHNLVFLGVEFILTKLYINSYVAMLNARRSVREMDSASSPGISNVLNLRTTQHSELGIIRDLAMHDKAQSMINLAPGDYQQHRKLSDRKHTDGQNTIGIAIHRSVETRADREDDESIIP